MSLSAPDAVRIYLDTDLALEQIGDAQAMREMLVMLEETLRRDIPQIAELLARQEITAANRLLHPIKGFIPIFCGPALCEHVVEVERLSKDPASTEVAGAYAVLMPRLNQLVEEVSGYLAHS